MGQHVFFVVELQGLKSVHLSGGVPRQGKRAFKTALRVAHQVQLCAVHLQQLTALPAHALRHENVHRVAGESAQGGKGNAGVAAGHFHNGLARHKCAGGLGAGDHAGGHPVFDTAGEVEAFQLGVHRAGAAVQAVVDTDERCVPRKRFKKFHVSSPFACFEMSVPAMRQKRRGANKKGCVPAHTALQKGPAKSGPSPKGASFALRRGRG